MLQIIKNVFLILLFYGSVACNKYKYQTSTGVEIVYPKGTEHYLNMTSDYIFNQDTLYTLELTIPEKALEFIDQNPAAKEYIEGSLIFNQEKISPIKIRYKGSRGQFWSGLSGDNPNNPSGSKVTTKLSLRLKFNETGVSGKFYGLQNLQLHSQNNDPSQIRERLAYKLYRDMGVPAPRSVHVKLYINGEYYGLYALTENIDKQFLSNNFFDATGNLYKDVWPTKVDGNTASSERDFLMKLETNILSKTNANIITSFANELVQSEGIESMEIVRNRMDIDKIISYIIVDRAIRNDDGAFMWYGTSNHNYFWYETPKNRKVHLIPWDMDAVFNFQIPFVIQQQENPIEDSNKCKMFYKEEWAITNSNYCDKFTKTIAMFETEHENRIAYFLSEVFAANKVDSLIEYWCNQIQQATIEAAELHTDAVSVEVWKKSVNDLRNKINYSREQFQN
ncbi:MAG TPA: CotH kinase family protein [Bacteroidales bacterium]|nr:MAG: Inner spore coat protein H [Bacteroidetes bacterium ADurb.Bin217]HPM12227.1 CotH kinase family protein [Bacteroidales bacterium]